MHRFAVLNSTYRGNPFSPYGRRFLKAVVTLCNQLIAISKILHPETERDLSSFSKPTDPILDRNEIELEANEFFANYELP